MFGRNRSTPRQVAETATRGVHFFALKSKTKIDFSAYPLATPHTKHGFSGRKYCLLSIGNVAGRDVHILESYACSKHHDVQHRAFKARFNDKRQIWTKQHNLLDTEPLYQRRAPLHDLLLTVILFDNATFHITLLSPYIFGQPQRKLSGHFKGRGRPPMRCRILGKSHC